MAIKLWGSKTPGNAQDVRDINLLKNKKKVIKMLVIVVVLFCVAWFPLQMYNILQVTWPEVNEYRYINIIWLCFDWLAMSNSCYNPFIYGIYNVSLIPRQSNYYRIVLPAYVGGFCYTIANVFLRRMKQMNFLIFCDCRRNSSGSSTSASRFFKSSDTASAFISPPAV